MVASLAIVVPSGPGERAWQALLPQLAQLRAQEIILVLPDSESSALDFNPADAAVSVVRSPAGRARQLNAGAAASVSEWLWFLHADSRLVGSTVDALLRFVRSDVPAIGYFDLRFLQDGPPWMFLNTIGAQLRCRLFGLPFGDQGFVMPRQVYHAIGGFDENIGPGEDHAAIWKARSQGIPLHALRAPLYSSARRYAEHGWCSTTFRHLRWTLSQARRFSRAQHSP
jgi:hypothetical protein